MRRARIMLHLDSLNFVNKSLSVRCYKYVEAQIFFLNFFFVILFNKICFELYYSYEYTIITETVKPQIKSTKKRSRPLVSFQTEYFLLFLLLNCYSKTILENSIPFFLIL
jgi:hypothetical protein